MSYVYAVITLKVNAFILNFLVKITYVNGCDEGLVEWDLYAYSCILSPFGILRANINSKKLADGVSNLC